MQRTFAGGYFFVPRTQIQQRPIVFAKRRPHQPPAVGRSFQQAAVRSGTAVKRIRHRDLRTGGCHRCFRLLGEWLETRRNHSSQYGGRTHLEVRISLSRHCVDQAFSQANQDGLFVKQIFLPSLHKLLQRLAPVFRNPTWVVAFRNCVERRLIHQQLVHSVHVALLGIGLVQR